MDKQVKILICGEASEWPRPALEKLEGQGGTAVFEQRDGSKLLARIREDRPQAVIMDMFMPGLDALGVLQAISADSGEHPLCVVSASYTTPMLEREVLSSGAAYFAIRAQRSPAAGPGDRDTPPDRGARPYQGLPLPSRLHHHGHRGPGDNKRRHKAALSQRCKGLQHHQLPGGAGHTPRHRGGLGPGGCRCAELLFRLHHT